MCYCLGVTSIDPERNEACLLVERFISRERDEPPDIDIDFEHERREEVIQYVYRKYGRERSALAATVIMYRPRSAVRDVGKAFGLDPLQLARLARTIQWWDGTKIDEQRVREAGINPRSSVLVHVMKFAHELMGFPRHLSQHVGGIVISAGRLDELVPIENATMEDRTVVQWDKDDLDELKLLKVDLLGLGMLTALRRAFKLTNDYWEGSGKYPKQYTLGECPAGRSGRLRHDLQCGHGRRVPDRIARADVDAAAAAAEVLLRPRHRSRDRASGPDPGRHGRIRICAGEPAKRK